MFTLTSYTYQVFSNQGDSLALQSWRLLAIPYVKLIKGIKLKIGEKNDCFIPINQKKNMHTYIYIYMCIYFFANYSYKQLFHSFTCTLSSVVMDFSITSKNKLIHFEINSQKPYSIPWGVTTCTEKCPFPSVLKAVNGIKCKSNKQ